MDDNELFSVTTTARRSIQLNLQQRIVSLDIRKTLLIQRVDKHESSIHQDSKTFLYWSFLRRYWTNFCQGCCCFSRRDWTKWFIEVLSRPISLRVYYSMVILWYTAVQETNILKGFEALSSSSTKTLTHLPRCLTSSENQWQTGTLWELGTKIYLSVWASVILLMEAVKYLR